VTVKKSLKDETEKLGIDLGEAVEQFLKILCLRRNSKHKQSPKNSVT